ncbi:phage tail protein [Pigmentiphaga sp. CHJ604]|uniref:phage tail protein n=1 Tax=Pigmentiphaga sp. CHJ604 TaxID=3081984 RepID=UPI0030D5BFFB
MLMCLDQFTFSMSTLPFQQLQRQATWRHPSVSRVGTRSGHQFTGAGDDTITISGWIAPELAGDRASIDRLRELANEGGNYVLVDGTGAVYGAFAITGIAETGTLHYRDGTPRRIEFNLNLERTDDDIPVPAAAGAAASVATAASEASGVADSVGSVGKALAADFPTALEKVGQVAGLIGTVGDVAGSAMGMLGAVQAQLSTATAVVDQLQSVRRSVNGLARAMEQIRAGNVRASISTLSTALSNVQDAAAGASKLLTALPEITTASVTTFVNTAIDLENGAYATAAALQDLGNG